MKTNALRALESLGIPYELRSYEVDAEDLSAGQRGLQVRVAPQDYARATQAVLGPIASVRA